MAAAGGTDGLSKAQERLEEAERELREAKAEVPDAQRVAEAKLGVAKAELGVAKAEWQAAPQEEKTVLKDSVRTAQKVVEAATKAYENALDAAAPPHGVTRRTEENQYLRVTARITGAKKMQGIRAAAYMRAEEHCARYDGTKEQSFRYEGDDLHMSLLFLAEDRGNAEKFQSSLSLWHMHNPLVGLEGKVFVTKQVEVVQTDTTERVFLGDYVAQDEESPMGSLADFKAAVSSCPTISVGSDNELVQFQCFEKPECFASVDAYRLHIKDKAKFKDLRDNPNNLLAGSWTPFHQHLDGLNTPGNLPQVAVQFGEDKGEEYVGNPPTKRSRVEVVLEFRDAASEEIMAPRLKNGSVKVADQKWSTFVHVLDANKFKECLEWKHQDTKRRWRQFDDE